eukprot:765662-Hanusia_phi.AAC.2
MGGRDVRRGRGRGGGEERGGEGRGGERRETHRDRDRDRAHILFQTVRFVLEDAKQRKVEEEDSRVDHRTADWREQQDDEEGDGGAGTAGLCVLVLCMLVYTSSMFPSVPGGDSGELIVAGCTLGLPHPPGYPTMAM